MRRLSLLALVAVLAVAATAIAKTKFSTYTLPGQNVFPEGIDTRGKTFYVSSTTDGTIFRGTTKRQAAEVFLPGGADGRTTAVGVEEHRGRLYVAGGATGTLWIYDVKTKALAGRHETGPGGFLNDVAVERDGDAVVTDSQRPFFLVVSPDGTTRQVAYDQGDASGFNANGIVALGRNRVLFVDSNDGTLNVLDTDTGEQRTIAMDDEVTNGDGLVLKGRTLYVVRNQQELIAKVKLRRNLRSARLVSQTTSPLLQFPTTAALAQGRLLVVNSQFDQRGGDPVEPFTVASVRKP
jgi:Cu-Zn family superoxide dismutase